MNAPARYPIGARRIVSGFDGSDLLGYAPAGVSRTHRRPVVLHITGDYPDPLREPTTQAVKRLIDRTDAADHIIFSLKRIADPRRGYFEQCSARTGQMLFAYGHFGLPMGLGLADTFEGVAERILRELAAHDIHPDIVHAHRLTFDGLAGDIISRRLGIPLFVSVRGEVESKVFRFKPTYRARLAEIVARAARVYLVSAWYGPHLERHAPPAPEAVRLLPNIVSNAVPQIRPQVPGSRFVSIANLDIWRKKGIHRLLAGFARALGPLASGDPAIGLDIIGDGTPAARKQVQRLVARHGLTERVRLRGALPNSQLLSELSGYLALALPSRNETFGMAYTEALFAGVPILYGRNTGIDGYLDGLSVGVPVEIDNVRDIALALRKLARDNAAFRNEIAMRAPELFVRFDPDRVVSDYACDILQAAGISAVQNLSDVALKRC